MAGPGGSAFHPGSFRNFCRRCAFPQSRRPTADWRNPRIGQTATSRVGASGLVLRAPESVAPVVPCRPDPKGVGSRASLQLSSPGCALVAPGSRGRLRFVAWVGPNCVGLPPSADESIGSSGVPARTIGRCARSGSLSQVVLLVSEAAGKSTKADGLSGCAEGALGIFLNRLLFLGLQHFFRAISYNLHDPHR